MIGNSKRGRRWAGAFCLLALCLLAGCFDYEIGLELKKDGKSALEVSLSLPEALAPEQGARRLDTVVRPIPTISKKVSNGRLILTEKVEVDQLDMLAAWRVLFEIETLETGILGMTAYTYRLLARLSPAEGDLPDRTVLPGTEWEKKAPKIAPVDPAEIRARRLLAASLAGHQVTMAFTIPGKVEKAWPLMLGSSQVDPQITQKGRRVAWRVPLSVLINENIRHNLVFRADFKGDFEMRTPGQRSTKSRFPTAEDVQMAEKDWKNLSKEKLKNKDAGADKKDSGSKTP